LGKDQLVTNAERVVAAPVERFGRYAAEVAYAGQRDVHQAIEKFVHAVAPQGNHRPDGHTLAELERRNRFLCLRDYRLLSGDGRKLVDRSIDQFGVARGFAEADVD